MTKAKKAFTAYWTKQKTYTTGYQIQYSKNKNFSSGNATLTINKKGTTSWKISGLKKNKRYYVRIRTYTKVKFNGNKIKVYSDWSKVGSVKTK